VRKQQPSFMKAVSRLRCESATRSRRLLMELDSVSPKLTARVEVRKRRLLRARLSKFSTLQSRDREGADFARSC
jgi:hypothetical protein